MSAGITVTRSHRRARRTGELAAWLWLALTFVPRYLVDLLVASSKVAWDVVTPRDRMSPAVLAVRTRARSPAELTVVANLISLTPGTLVLDVSGNRRVLYVHCMFVVDDGSAMAEEIARLEARVLSLLRGPGHEEEPG